MIEDTELLRRYADERSEEAFAELARRRVDLVYSVALRQVGGDAQLAEDVTQKVFVDLARKAATLAGRTVLSGWLYRSAQFAASDVVRAERSRRAREQGTHLMNEISASAGDTADWEKLRPILDQVMGELSVGDRDAVALRFFEGRPFADIGGALRLTEDAARKRVERALDKLHALLARRGVKSTAAALGLALENQTGVAAPAGLAASVTGAALAGTTIGAGGWLATFMTISKLQVAIASAVTAAFATAYVLQGKTNAVLRGEIAAFQGQQASVAALRVENQRLADTVAEVEMLRHDDVELARLSQDVAQAQRAQKEAVRLAGARDREVAAQAEVDRMNREGTALVEKYKDLMTLAKDASLSAEARAEADAAAKQQLTAIQAKQREIQQFIVSTRAADPAFKFSGTLSRPDTPIRGAGATAERASDGTKLVTLRLPHTDQRTALETYELIAGVKLVRDPSLASVRGEFDFKAATATQAETAQALRTALREQLNIVLEPASDGSVVAKLGPPK
jgi:RNA polymerase sigma factor (sigma-70 family)